MLGGHPNSNFASTYIHETNSQLHRAITDQLCHEDPWTVLHNVRRYFVSSIQKYNKADGFIERRLTAGIFSKGPTRPTVKVKLKSGMMEIDESLTRVQRELQVERLTKSTFGTSNLPYLNWQLHLTTRPQPNTYEERAAPSHLPPECQCSTYIAPMACSKN